jgi:hypothetical protein
MNRSRNENPEDKVLNVRINERDFPHSWQNQSHKTFFGLNLLSLFCKLGLFIAMQQPLCMSTKLHSDKCCLTHSHFAKWHCE